MWAHRFRTAFSWKHRGITAPSAFLPYGHKLLVEHRQHIKASLAALQVPGQLMLNYDQVWRIRYIGPSTCFYKSEELAGQEKSEIDTRPKLRAVVKRVMDKLGAEPLPEPKTKCARKERVLQHRFHV